MLIGSALAMVLIIAFLALTGTWHLGFRPFRINADRMTAERLGFRVSDPRDIEIVDGIGQAFAGGFNRMIASRSASAWSDFAKQRSAFFRSFAHEGAATGYRLRKPWSFSPSRFEADLVRTHSGYRHLHYVGLGFFAGMRNHRPDRLQKIVEELDPLHGMLCWDGYGFKFGFFDFGRNPECVTRFNRLPGYAANVAYQGLGRSLWFRFMDTPDQLVSTLRSFGDYAADAASGVGLASVFAAIDRPERGLAVIQKLPAEWHRNVQLGMCFGYKARAINDPEYFAEILARLDSRKREAIETAIRECDAVEAHIRADGGADGYRRWREQLAASLEMCIQYPFVAVGTPASAAANNVVASV